mgnify:CR=1 FL=1
MNRILICNSQRSEADTIQAALGNQYTIYLMTAWKRDPISPEEIDAIVLDTNFTPEHGLDFLADVCGKTHIPVLLLTQPDELQTAIKARRIGAFNYCIKTEQLPSILGLSVREMLLAFNDQMELKRTIIEQKERIAELESELNTYPGHHKTWNKKISADRQKQISILQKITKYLNHQDITLPDFPKISLELEKMVQKDSTMEEIAALITSDNAVSTKLIAIANSPRHGGLRQSHTVEQALNVLGLKTAKEYVDIIANRSLYANCADKYYVHLHDLWKHCVACAHASYVIAFLLRLPKPGQVFLMGLLHDIGKLLLLQIISELQNQNSMESNLPNFLLDNFLGRHHAIFGRKLLEKWKLPEEITVTPEYHEDIYHAPVVSRELLAVTLANQLAKLSGYNTSGRYSDKVKIEVISKSLGLNSNDIHKITNELIIFMEESNLNFD